MRPSASFAHSTRTHSSAVDLAVLADRRAWSATAQSRSQPSSCDDEVRSFSGQSGQVSALFSCSGGCGMISSWVTDAAPWRFEVPMQSEPVSPPPITMTCLPLAVIVPLRRGARLVVAGDALVLLGQEFHREMDAVELAARDRRVARLLGAAGQHHGVELVEQRLAPTTSTPTSTPVRNVTPSASICSMRRSIRCFSILKSGMP